MSLSRCACILFQRQIFKSAKLASVSGFNKYENNAVYTYQVQQNRNFKNFGHKKDKPPHIFTSIYYCSIAFLCVASFINWRHIRSIFFPSIEAASKIQQNEDTEEKTLEDTNQEEPKKKKNKKEKVGFRERKIVEYENRIRHFSTPDKVFRYFATLEIVYPNGTHEVLMTPDDFLRSLTPGVLQPEDLGLDKFKRYDPKTVQLKLELDLDENSIFYKLGSYGLITFSDYMFLLTVLSTSRRHFEIAFRMFDVNGDGDVDYEEFKQVSNLIRMQSSIGNRHRDRVNTGNTFKGVNSALMTFFFGPDLKKKLKIEKFLDFQEQLQNEILSLEFERKNPDDNGFINEVAFTELLLAYAGFSEKKKTRILKRVKKTFKDCSQGIHKDEYLHFFHFLSNINDVDTALTFYHIAGASIDPATLKHVAKTVSHVDLSDHIIKVVYTIFDENMDGQLSNREFVAVLKNRALRDMKVVSSEEIPEISRDDLMEIIHKSQLFQDIFSEQPDPTTIEFGHVCENPNEWEQRFEKRDFKNNHYQGKMRWGNKNGDYGEHYWDLGHAG